MNEPEPIKYSLKDIALIYLFILLVFSAICPLLYVHLAVEQGYGAEFASKISYLEKVKVCYFTTDGMIRFALIFLYSILSLCFLLVTYLKKTPSPEKQGCLLKVIDHIGFAILIGILPLVSNYGSSYLGFHNREKNLYVFFIIIPMCGFGITRSILTRMDKRRKL